MVWFLGKKAINPQGSTWSGELKPWHSLRYVTSDAGTGRKAGITQCNGTNADSTKFLWKTGWMSSTPSGKPDGF
jgi:hypothetical protein